jgi:hypothetical protein
MIDRAVDVIFDSRKRRWTEEDRLALLLSSYTALIDEGRLLDPASGQSSTPVRRRRRASAARPEPFTP